MVCEKTDGERHLLLAHEGQAVIAFRVVLLRTYDEEASASKLPLSCVCCVRQAREWMCLWRRTCLPH